MDMMATIQTWFNVLRHPSEQTFVQEQSKPQATLTTALIWMVISGAISGVLGWLFLNTVFGADNPLLPMLSQMNIPPEAISAIEQTRATLADSTLGPMLGSAGLAAILITPFSFLIGAGIFYLLGRLLGGNGDFGRYAYLLATFQAPLGIINVLLGLIPGVGACLNLLLAVYSIVLTYRATKVGLNLSKGRAMIGVAIPVGIALLLFLFAIATIIVAFLRIFGS